MPLPDPGDVLVRVRSVGACGSDVHYYMKGRIGPYVVDALLVLGHEVSGVIADVGDGVLPERSGQRVAGLDALRPGGTAGVVGLGPPEIPISVGLVAMEIVLTGVFRYVDTWSRAIAAAQHPGVDLDALVTAEDELEDAEAALTSDADPESMKSVVVVSRA